MAKAEKNGAGKGADHRYPLRCAAVDIGSNAIRFCAAEFTAPGTYTVLESIRSPVRLGHGVFLKGRLVAAAMNAACEALADFAARMKGLRVQRHRVVATSAVRESANGEAFIRRIQSETGLKLEVITGSEEARLVYLAVKRRIPMGSKPWLLVDLGGGSVEVTVADGDGVLSTESHTMGAVRLLEDLAQNADEPGRFAQILEEYVGTLRAPSQLSAQVPAGYAATGGNIEALADLALGGPGPDGVSTLKVSDLERIIRQLARMSYRERIEVLGLREDRADVILPAAVVYHRLAQLAHADAIVVPRVGIKEGVLLDLDGGDVGRHDRGSALDVERAALALGRKYAFDEAHGLHVAELALSLFGQLRELHGMGGFEERILCSAAILHDIGGFVSFSRHHKHSLYLIANSSLGGLSPREVMMVANVARYHRRSAPKPTHEAFQAMDKEAREVVVKLASLLRLADAMDREHRQRVHGVRAAVRRGKAVLRLSGDGDLLLEGWALKRKSDLFEKCFGLKIQVVGTGGTS